MTGQGLTHCAIECGDLDRSIDFYARFGGFKVVHRREGVAWISDRTRPFAIVLVVTDEVRPVGPFAHLGSACRDLAEFDRLVRDARNDGVLRDGPHRGEGPSGTWAFLDDPDGNTFELSVGQAVEEMVGIESTPPGPVKRPIVGVMGSGDDSHEEIAVPLGTAIARAGWHLLTGGGGGVMAAVGRGFTHQQPRAGMNLGILRGDSQGEALPGYPNAYVEFPIATHLPGGELEPDSRNHLNILSSNVVLALPGRIGTRAEIKLALRYRTSISVHQIWREEFPGVPWFTDVSEAISFVGTAIETTGSGRHSEGGSG